MQNSTAVDEALHRELGVESPRFLGQLLPQVVELVRTCRRLPVGEEYAIRRGSTEFLQGSRELGDRSLGLAHAALRFLDPSAHRDTSAKDLDNFNLLVDSIDSVLERVDDCLKEALTEPAAPEAAATDQGAAPSEASAGRGGNKYVEAGRHLAKPQARWRQLVDNGRTEFVPRIVEKHNQLVPLPPELLEAQRRAGLREGGAGGAGSTPGGRPAPAEAASAEASALGALESHLSAMGVGRQKGAHPQLPHPYEAELAALEVPNGVLELRKPVIYERMEDTPLVLVETGDELRAMVEEIKATCSGGEIAVDVEHHDFRSYRGFVCLVQISTRRKDFILDPFGMFSEMHMLNEIFSDPSILKVLHGADRDVLWLQRDFSAYIVNMFDTGQATRAMRLQGGFGLANLVSHFCGVKLDKKYQTADWRERPLPKEMLYYARCDTHYLLYCYDCLRNILLTQQGTTFNLASASAGDDFHATDEGIQSVRSVMEKSTDLCRKRYGESALDGANAAMRLCERFSSKQRPPDSRQFRALQALAEWRDRLARSLDESWNFVAPDACLWRIALALPATASRLRSTCNPLPQVVQDHAQELVDLLAKAAEDVRLTPLLRPAAPPAAPPGLDGSRGPPGAAAAAAPAARQGAAPPAARQQPAAPAREWPCSAGASGGPIVPVVCGRQRAPNGSGDPRMVLGSLFDGGSSSSDGEAGAAAAGGLPPGGPPPGGRGRVDAIRSALRFLPAAPAPGASAAEAAQRVVPAAAAGAAPDASLAPGAVVMAEEPVAPLGRRKRKRRAGGAMDCLESVVNAMAADSCSAPMLGDPDGAVSPATGSGKPAKKKKRKGAGKALGAATAVDPYL